MSVIDAITAGGKFEAPAPQRIFPASVTWLVAGILLSGGGGQVPGAPKAGAIAIALPFTLVLLLCCVSLFVGLGHESRGIIEVGGALSKGISSTKLNPQPTE